jgi:hypothetical protein
MSAGAGVVSTVKEVETTMVITKVVIDANAIFRQRSLRLRLLSRFACSWMTREPSLILSLCGATLASGVPSARQNAN